MQATHPTTLSENLCAKLTQHPLHEDDVVVAPLSDQGVDVHERDENLVGLVEPRLLAGIAEVGIYKRKILRKKKEKKVLTKNKRKKTKFSPKKERKHDLD